MKKLTLFMLIVVLLPVLLELPARSSGLFLTSAPTSLETTYKNGVGAIIIGGMIAYYVVAIVLLIMTVSFSTDEAILAQQAENEARRKRSLPMDSQYLVDLALMLDHKSCFSRLLCEVEADPEFQRSSEERLLISVFDRLSETEPSEFNKKNRDKLEEAKILGKTSKDLSACSKQFDQCPFNAGLIFNLWNIALGVRRAMVGL